MGRRVGPKKISVTFKVVSFKTTVCSYLVLIVILKQVLTYFAIPTYFRLHIYHTE